VDCGLLGCGVVRSFWYVVTNVWGKCTTSVYNRNLHSLKAKAVPLHATKALGVDRRYSSYPFLPSALDGGEWSVSRPGRSLTPWKDHGIHCIQETWWAPKSVWTHEARGKILSPLSGIEARSPCCPTHSPTLYWLSYPAHTFHILTPVKPQIWHSVSVILSYILNWFPNFRCRVCIMPVAPKVRSLLLSTLLVPVKGQCHDSGS
jgi:hypothetical protein